MNTYKNPVTVVFGAGAFEGFLSEIKAVKGSVLLVTGDKSISGIEGQILNALKNKSLLRINKVKANPDITQLYEHYKTIKEHLFSPDCIIAVGGGSVIDTAKTLKALLSRDIEDISQMRRAVQSKDFDVINCKLIVCPTSAGTGSEVTKWATAWDNELRLKYSVEHESLYADKAYIDYELTATLPLKQSVSCAFDAFSHAVESYWSPKSCAISREYSLRAIELFNGAIDDFLENQGTKEREMLSMCGYFAGLAFSHTRTTVCHAISYPLTLLYDIPHGIAACMSVPFVLELNEAYITESGRLFKALDINTADELTRKNRRRLENARIPYMLSDYGFAAADIDFVSERCIAPGRSDNNPVKIEADDIKAILRKM